MNRQIHSPIVELRQYTLHPGKRESLIELFDREFIETQEAVGIQVIGQFRNLDDPDQFVWLRGFNDMSAREQSLNAFYSGPVWKEHRDAANATMIDSDNVLLLRPAHPNSGFVLNGNRPSLGSRAKQDGFIAASIYYFDKPVDSDFINYFENTIKPVLSAAGASPLATFVTEDSPNTFPRLPVREGENVFVHFASFRDEEAHQNHLTELEESKIWKNEISKFLKKTSQRKTRNTTTDSHSTLATHGKNINGVYSPIMYHPTTRVLAVLALLQAHGRMSGAELAQRLEVNIRTLRRYIIMLQDLGIPIEAERGRNGAYVLSAGFKLPPMMFTNEEALALTVGLISARRLNLADTDRAIESALAKLERVMPLDLKSRVRALTETITLNQNTVSSPAPSEVVLSALSSAAQLKQRVRIQYRPPQGEETERDFDAYGLTYYQHKWYVVGYCHLRKDLRSFRLDRVQQVKEMDAHFERPDGFDPLAHVMQAIVTLPRKYPFELLLKTDIVTAQKEVFDFLGVLEAHKDGVLMRGSVEDLDWLARQISIFSFDFVVIEPEELKVELQKHSKRLASHVSP